MAAQRTGRPAEQGTDNSGTEIHFRFPAEPHPARSWHRHKKQAEQGTDNSGTVIHFRFPAGPRPAGAVSGEGPGREGKAPSPERAGDGDL